MSALAKVILKPRRAEPFFNRHPWLFGGAIEKIDGPVEPGSEVDVVSSGGEFIARGLFNPHSQIRVRLYTWDEQTPLDRDFWSTQLDRAIAMRRALFADASSDDAHRLVYSESDGMSGLIVDRYGDWLLVQLTSLALGGRRDMLVELLQEKLSPAGIWLRTEKGIRESESLDMADGLIAGKEPPRPLFIEENGLRFGVDVVEGQKTGFYLDQRENRAAVAQLVRGHRVLDLFCHTGAFGIAALKLGGANDVVGIDVSESGLTMARANADLNDVGSKIRFENAKAFDALERLAAAGEKFDTVILDPPKMTRHRAGMNQALRGYFSLNRLALDVLKPGGLLVTCSCSGLVSREDFESVLAKVAVQANRPLQILAARGQAADHPVSVHCLETGYLKCYLCWGG